MLKIPATPLCPTYFFPAPTFAEYYEHFVTAKGRNMLGGESGSKTKLIFNKIVL
jgi:hypothetical protein